MLAAIYFRVVLAAEDAGQAFLDGLTQGGLLGYILAGVALLALVLPLVLKAFGKSIPGLDPILDVVLGLVKKLAASKKAAPPPTAPEKQGVEAVVEVKKE